MTDASKNTLLQIRDLYPRLTIDNLGDHYNINKMLNKVKEQVNQILSTTSILDDKYQYRNLYNFNRVAMNKKEFKVFMAIEEGRINYEYPN